MSGLSFALPAGRPRPRTAGCTETARETGTPGGTGRPGGAGTPVGSGAPGRTRFLRAGSVAAAILLVMAAGCHDVSVSVAEVGSVEITPNPATLMMAESVTARATPRSRGGAPMDDREVEWSSDDPDVASISASGVLEGLRPGTTRIRAVADGVEGSADVEVLEMGRIQVASGGGTTARARFDSAPEAGNLLVAVLWHRHDWQTPWLASGRVWERVALHVEGGGDVGTEFRKGLAVWVRHAEDDEPRRVSGGWEELRPRDGRETFLVVLELAGYGDLLEVTDVASSGASTTDRLTFSLSGPGAVVGIAGSRDGREATATWTDLGSTDRFRHTESSNLSSVVHTALGRLEDRRWEGSVRLDESVPALGVMLRFGLP